MRGADLPCPYADLSFRPKQAILHTHAFLLGLSTEVIILPCGWLKSTWNSILGIVSVEDSVTKVVLQHGVVGPTPNPQPGGPGINLCLASTLRPVRHGWPYQKYKTPAGIALQVIETSKPHHHDKVVTLWDESNVSLYFLFIVRSSSFNDN